MAHLGRMARQDAVRVLARAARSIATLSDRQFVDAGIPLLAPLAELDVLLGAPALARCERSGPWRRLGAVVGLLSPRSLYRARARGGERLLAVMAAIACSAFLTGCARSHFTVFSAPVAPEQAPAFKVQSPEIPASAVVIDFVVNEVDTQYPEKEKDLYRSHFSRAIPNLLQETLGKRQLLAAVTRASSGAGTGADYVISGDFNFFERIGTGGREWIPFAPLFGLKINEAWVRGTTHIIVTNQRTGRTVLDRAFTEERRDRTSIYARPAVGYFQAEYLGTLGQAILDAIRQDAPSVRAVGEARAVTKPRPEPPKERSTGNAEEKLRALERLRRDGLLSQEEYEARRAKLLDEAF